MYRQRRTARPAPVVEEPDIEDSEEEESSLDLEDEPAFERREDESAQDAQDRIEAKYRARATSPLRAIRASCVLCMGAQPKEVAKCTAVTCPLHKFRDGKNPYQKHKRKD